MLLKQLPHQFLSSKNVLPPLLITVQTSVRFCSKAIDRSGQTPLQYLYTLNYIYRGRHKFKMKNPFKKKNFQWNVGNTKIFFQVGLFFWPLYWQEIWKDIDLLQIASDEQNLNCLRSRSTGEVNDVQLSGRWVNIGCLRDAYVHVYSKCIPDYPDLLCSAAISVAMDTPWVVLCHFDVCCPNYTSSSILDSFYSCRRKPQPHITPDELSTIVAATSEFFSFPLACCRAWGEGRTRCRQSKVCGQK